MTPSSWLAFGVASLLAFGLTEQVLDQMRLDDMQAEARHEQTRRHLRAMLHVQIINLTTWTSIPDEPDTQDEWLDSSARYALESGEAWPRVD